MADKLTLNEEESPIGRITGIIFQFAAVAALALFISTFCFFAVSHDSKSMEPGIPAESTVFVSKISYTFAGPKRFDVVAFRRAGAASDSGALVRRVVGLPGETVKIEKGVIYIDGKALEVSGYFSEITSDGIAQEGIKLKDNEYFVLGDTPANSEDSRSSTVGAVKRADIIGKAWLQAISFTDFRMVK